MGFSLKRMFKNPFGSHSVFHTVTHNPLAMGAVSALVPPVGAAMAVAKAVRPALGVLKMALATPPTPAVPVAMPGGQAIVAPAVPVHRAAGKHATTRRATRRRSAPTAQRASRKKRKLKFGSPAWRKRYMKPKRKR